MNIKIVVRLFVACLLLCLFTGASAANWVKQIRSNSLEDKLQVVIDLEENPDFNVFVLSNPIRLVVDVRGRPSVDFLNRLSFKNRGVSQVRTGMNEDDKVRVVLDLLQDYRWKAYKMPPEGGRGYRVVVDVFDYPGQLAKASRTSPAGLSKRAMVKTGTTVSDRQLVLESTTDLPEKPRTIAEIAEKPTFTPTVKEAADVLQLESPPSIQTVVKSAPEKKSSLTPQINLVDGKDLNVPVAKTASVIEGGQLVASVTLKPKGSIFDDPKFQPISPKPSAVATQGVNVPVATTPKPRGPAHKKLLIMIDPGHGGKDPGAIGKGGTREKDIVLQIAKRLQRRINKISGMKAVLTRRSDRYITLRDRLALASKRRPQMFVSIHADAAQNRSAKGSSVFILSNRGASSKTAKWIAKRENAVDAKYGIDVKRGAADVDNFLLGMQQDITIESSHRVASKTLRQLKGIGRVHKRRVERAGFAVLKASKIPSMLVETAFLSNPEEERKLKKASYQEEIAEAIATGIEEYFRSQGDL